ncbi:MAG: glutamyl-tRNA reductase [Phycisphaeraceae bacterium]
MRISLLGLNHRTADVELREALAPSPDDLPAFYARLRSRFPGAEAVLLSTCNRLELYVARPAGQGPDTPALRQLIVDHAQAAGGGEGGDGGGGGLDPASTIAREQEAAVTHLFRVCAGLESMVLGEAQILGQVKRAYEAGVAAGAVGPVLHKVFQQALAAGKHARAATGIDAGRVSVGSVAVEFTRRVFESFADKTVLCLGAGEIAKLTLRHLMSLAPARLWVANRTLERAQLLAHGLSLAADGVVRPWDDLDELLVEADVVVTSTGARQPILTAERCKAAVRRRRRRPLVIVDIALPRDVEPAVGALPNVYLYNIDDLNDVVAGNVDQRREQVEHCQAHVAHAVAQTMRQVQHRELGQLIRRLRHQLHEIGALESRRTARKLLAPILTPPATPATPATSATSAIDGGDDIVGSEEQLIEALLEEHTHRLINKILHLPLSQIEAADESASLGFYAAALRRLFDLEDDTPPDDDAPPRP